MSNHSKSERPLDDEEPEDDDNAIIWDGIARDLQAIIMNYDSTTPAIVRQTITIAYNALYDAAALRRE